MKLHFLEIILMQVYFLKNCDRQYFTGMLKTEKNSRNSTVTAVENQANITTEEAVNPHISLLD